MLTRAEVAKVLGLHASTVARWAAAGLLPCVRTPSGERRYRRDDVEDLLNLNMMAKPQGGDQSGQAERPRRRS